MRRLVPFLLVLVVLAGCTQSKPTPAGTANSLLVIVPYKHAGAWVFDDPARGLKQEPFVAGIPQIIDKLVAGIPNADRGFRLTFSKDVFPGYTHTLVWRRKDMNGNWYHCPRFDAEGWLCPALLKFFREPPKTIYFKAEAM